MPKGKFSSRSTSFINSKDQPCKSSSTKQNKGIYPTTAIKIGTMEAMNLLINNNTDALVRLNMQYSSSTIARRNMNEIYDGNIDSEFILIPENARNKNAEINNIYFKAFGCRIEFDDEEYPED